MRVIWRGAFASVLVRELRSAAGVGAGRATGRSGGLDIVARGPIGAVKAEGVIEVEALCRT